ncbi:hypothetical protein [Tengunoibacter tsumagoiensis]|uniref:Uncharacterized protein n=1 Tax=Tengunoibacter tsumagoiensis TaxID=2014871 RepID=A0A402A621_9CHLR|nr:hypothetical protein [Tengunoibacter tsumagoiensis]GCE14588.1 hypothetical protein KTT_44470 [Tengunoibacter tsumagoiensis]
MADLSSGPIRSRSLFPHLKLIGIFSALFLLITLTYSWMLGPSISDQSQAGLSGGLWFLLLGACGIWGIGGLLLGILIQNRSKQVLPGIIGGLCLGLVGGLLSALIMNFSLTNNHGSGLIIVGVGSLLFCTIGSTLGSIFGASTPNARRDEDEDEE